MPAAGNGLPGVQALFDNAACGLLLTRPDGTILRVNQTFCEWLGYRQDELLGQRRVQDLLTMGGRIFHQTHWAPLLQIQGSIAEVKLDVVHRAGHTVPLILNAVRREHPEGIFHELAVAVALDRHAYERELLNARRHAEELLAKQQQAQGALALAKARLRLALESAHLLVWDVDPATGERRYEDGVARLLGFDAPRAVGERQYADAIDTADREREALAFSQATDPSRPHQVYGCVYRLAGADGVQRTISSSGQGFFDANGKLLQFVGVLQDVTELSRQRAAAEDRALLAEQMVGIVSHDLRNPLSAIQMGAQLLARRELMPNQLRVVGHIATAANRAQRLIEDLLDFTLARVGGGLRLTPAPIDLHQQVSDSVEELALTFPQRQLEHLRIGEGNCAADADRLAQLIGNLVANAMAYGAADRPVRVISSIEARTFAVAVHNCGVPVPPDLLPGLFDPMTRGAEVGSAGRSVGLGLFIVREIARAHQGEVDVTSSERDGTTFTIRFPRGADEAR
ncbi:MAG: domain S-box protein [Variovorax sp.]|nr:domain S-box protein [Variovorax sp.]